MLKIYNTLTHQKEEFVPIDPGKIRMYVCGLTTYDYCHIGHARMLVAFDVIVRYLRASDYDVTYVRNITDIDDKIINRANENGEDFKALTERFIGFMHEDEKALSISSPDIEPRATGHITEIIAMIQTLVQKGIAYPVENGDVYYGIKQFPDYAKLSRKNPDELLSGARVAVDDIKQDPRDFALWKSAKAGEPGWDSPWGYGRPGWHIECSAMSTCCLGETFDIHGGGSDLLFPHHENEIAQSEGATGKKFVNTWMHNGPVRVDNVKMSKSLNNFFTIRDVLKEYPGEVIRYFLVSSHYRSSINYSEENLQTAYGALERFYNALKGLNLDVQASRNTDYEKRFRAAMDDDFNTPEALGVLFELTREINRLREGDKAQAEALAALLVELAAILGVLQMSPDAFLKEGAGSEVDPAYIDGLIAQRDQARVEKDWSKADQIRDELKSLNVILEDSNGQTTWRIERA